MGILIRNKTGNYSNSGLGIYSSNPLTSYFSMAGVTNSTQQNIVTNLYNSLVSANLLNNVFNINLPVGTNGTGIVYNVLDVSKYKWQLVGDVSSAYSSQGYKFQNGRYGFHNGIITDANLAGGFGTVICTTTEETYNNIRVSYGAADYNGYVISLSRFDASGNIRSRNGYTSDLTSVSRTGQQSIGFLGTKQTSGYTSNELWVGATKVSSVATNPNGMPALPAITKQPAIGIWNDTNNQLNYGSDVTMGMIINFKGLNDAQYIQLIGYLKTAAIALGLNGANSY